MLWPITTIALFLYFGWSDIFRFYRGEFIDLMFSCFFLGFGIMIAALIGFAIAGLVGLLFPKKWNYGGTAELVALRGSDGVSGNFFLGSGTIESSHYYFYYRKVGDGYKPEKVSTDNDVIVFERDRADGSMAQHYRDFTQSFYWLFGINGQKSRYEFSIPNGSIKKGFSL